MHCDWRAARLLGVALIGVVGGLAALALAPSPSARIGPGEMSLRAVPARAGTSSLALPPFGEVTATTHAAPLRLELRVDRLDIEDLQATLETPNPESTLRSDVERSIVPLLRMLALRSLLVALIGGLAAAALLPRRAPHRFLVAGASSTVTVAMLLLWSWGSYDTRSFDKATFVGPLERAPALLDAVQRHVTGLSEVSDRVDVLSRQISALYAAVEQDPVRPTTTILHISDIHSNPLGIEIARRLATAFDVDAVLDTGDLTSFGNPVERRITDLVDDIDVPYLYVAGNHDAPATRMVIGATPGVVSLTGQVVRVGRVRIVGFPDPTFTATNEITTREADSVRVKRAGDVAARVRVAKPDLLAVHDAREGAASVGLVPVIVSGHTHKRSQRVAHGTMSLTVGSTGATGLGAFTVETHHAYEAELLRFDGRRLVAVDYVTLDGVSGDFNVQRRLVDVEVRPPEPGRGGPL